MRKRIEDYRSIVGDKIIAGIYRKAKVLYGKNVADINSTYQGGGVAEILESLVPLLNDAGVNTQWDIFHGNPDFFQITKKFHNALQGEKINLSNIKKNNYIAVAQNFFSYQNLDQDVVIVHDPQPLPIVNFYQKRQPWIWRCHVDLSNPYPPLIEFLKEFILRYDTVVVSSENYKMTDLPIKQVVINPAIDPLSLKNKMLDDECISRNIRKFNIPTDLPIITQISRFDKWKDPIGVIEVYKQVREKINCRLILCGNMATDDPEGQKIYEGVKHIAQKLIDSGDLILIIQDNNILVNVLQRISSVIIQKSLKEGFGLTVTEAMWKNKPVVASNIGGIPLQIKDNETGFLCDPNDYEHFAELIVELLKEPQLCKKVGIAAHESVKKQFLITRLLEDHIDLISSALKPAIV